MVKQRFIRIISKRNIVKFDFALFHFQGYTIWLINNGVWFSQRRHTIIHRPDIFK